MNSSNQSFSLNHAVLTPLEALIRQHCSVTPHLKNIIFSIHSLETFFYANNLYSFVEFHLSYSYRLFRLHFPEENMKNRDQKSKTERFFLAILFFKNSEITFNNFSNIANNLLVNKQFQIQNFVEKYQKYYFYELCMKFYSKQLKACLCLS